MMNILMDLAFKIVENVIPGITKNKRKKDEIYKKIQEYKHEGNLKEIESKAKIILAEINNGGWLAKNWRSLLMITFVILLLNSYIIVPYLNAFEFINISLPHFPNLMKLLEMGLGGYLIGRSTESGLSKLQSIKINRIKLD